MHLDLAYVGLSNDNRLHRGVTVYDSGNRLLRHVIAFDTEEGWADCYMTDRFGNMIEAPNYDAYEQWPEQWRPSPFYRLHDRIWITIRCVCCAEQTTEDMLVDIYAPSNALLCLKCAGILSRKNPAQLVPETLHVPYWHEAYPV